MSATPQRSSAGSTAAQPSPAPSASKPFRFVPNSGQFDPRVRFQLRGAGGIWWFTDDALWLTVLEQPSPSQGTPARQSRAPSSSLPSRRGAGAEDPPRRGVHVKLTFPGMNPTARLVAADPQPGTMNYFRGNNAARWQANVPSYGSLRWEGVYPGLNLTFGWSGAGLGLTAESGSAAALSALRLRVEGADGVRVDEAGRLVGDTALGPVVLLALMTAKGTSLRPAVTGDVVAFTPAPASATPSSSVPIDDPADLLYSTYLGGSNIDFPTAIALGADGSIYVTGWTWSTDFPTTPGAFDRTCGSDGRCNPLGDPLSDTFITRLSPDGSTLVYSTYLGGSSLDPAYGLAVGSDGSAYVTGYTWSRDFPVTAGAFQPACAGNCKYADGFVTRLSADGSALVYSTYLGGRKSEWGWDVVTGADGSAYLTGYSNSRDFPVTAGAYDPTCGSDGRCNPYFATTHYDAFVTRLSADGTSLVFSTYLGGSDDDCGGGCAIALGSAGSVYVSGGTCSTDFPTTPGAYDTSYNGDSGDCASIGQGDVFVSELTSDGSALVSSSYLGGSHGDFPNDLAVGADGSVYVTGNTFSTDFPTTPGTIDPTCNTCPNVDGFVARFNADGSSLVFSTYLGGSTSAGGHGISVGADGAAYVTGETNSEDFPTTSGAFQRNCPIGDYCDAAYLTKLSADGTALLYSTFLGGTGGQGATDLAVDGSGAAYLTGVTYSSDFPTTAGAFDPTPNGVDDTFVTRLSPDLVSMHVGYINPFYRPQGSGYVVAARIAIQDASSSPVAGATVIVQLTQPDGSQATLSGTTSSGGLATVRRSVTQTGTYTFTVMNAVAYDWLYDPAHNHETSDSVTIP